MGKGKSVKIVTKESAIERVGNVLEDFGYDLLIQGPHQAQGSEAGRGKWVVTCWMDDDPTDRACSSARKLHVALNDVMEQMKLDMEDRGGDIRAQMDEEDEDTELDREFDEEDDDEEEEARA